MDELTRLICNGCGGVLIDNGNSYKCRNCGVVTEKKTSHSEEQILITSAYSTLRKRNFDDAEEEFTQIIEKFPKCHEAYFGLLMAKNGIIYVDDIKEGKKVPTCFKISIESIINNPLLNKAIAYSPKEIADDYKMRADKIENLRSEWLLKAKNEPKYDIFICFKDSDTENNIERTDDSVEASELYTFLTGKGYKVFFSRVSLKDKLSDNYEPYIFNAIETAQVMIVYGQKKEYFESVWMKNEWNRFLHKMAIGEKQKNGLVVAYEKMNVYDLPKVLSQKQCIDASKKTYYEDLVSHIEKVLKVANAPTLQVERLEIRSGQIAKKTSRLETEVLAERQFGTYKIEQVSADEDGKNNTAYKFLNNKMWSNASAIFNNVLAENRNCAKALWGNILLCTQSSNNEELKINGQNFNDLELFTRAVECADKKTALEYINIFMDISLSISQSNICELGNKYFETLAAYKTDFSKKYIDDISKIAIKNMDEKLFELFLKTVPATDVDFYIDSLTSFALAAMQKNDVLATKYFDKVIVIDEGNATALLALFMLSNNCGDGKDYNSKVCDIKDFSFFEKLLKFSDKTSYLKNLDVIINAVLCNFSVENITNIVKTFDYLVKLMPQNENKKLVSFFQIFANKLLESEFYDLSEKYFALMLSLDKNNHEAYWGVLLSKLKCANNEKLKNFSNADITKIDEFNSALAVCNDEKFINTAIEISAYQKYVWESAIKARNERAIMNEKCKNECATMDEKCKSVLNDKKYLKNIKIKDGVLIFCKKAYANFIVPYGVTEIGNGSFSKRSFKSKNIEHFDFPSSLKQIADRAFKGCSSLTSVTIPNSVTIIADRAFEGCSGLASVIIPDGETYIADRAFEGCSGLTSVTMPNSVTYIAGDIFKGCSGLTRLIIPNSVTIIADRTFEGCSGLTSVIIPNSVTCIFESAFEGCSGLTSVTIPNSVTTIWKSAFEGCSGLISVIIPNSVTFIGDSAFEGCSGLISVIIPNSVTFIGSNAFKGCSSLTRVTIPNSVTDICGSAFEGCSSLTRVTIPNSVTFIADRTFASCSSLTRVTIPNSVTDICGSAFEGCSSLTRVTIPNSVTYIADRTFASCSSLTRVTIPNSVTIIGDNAFEGCRSLTKPITPRRRQRF